MAGFATELSAALAHAARNYLLEPDLAGSEPHPNQVLRNENKIRAIQVLGIFVFCPKIGAMNDLSIYSLDGRNRTPFLTSCFRVP